MAALAVLDLDLVVRPRSRSEANVFIAIPTSGIEVVCCRLMSRWVSEEAWNCLSMASACIRVAQTQVVMKLTPTEPDVKTIVERIDATDIDLQPDFQRQEVWSNTKKKRLIDTVLRGWSIPPVHLVETVDNKLEVLDGQQRLAALRDFLHGRFSIDGSVTPIDARIRQLDGKFYGQLDIATRRRIDQYPIRCFRITDYLPEEPSELFYRLNQPTMLTAGEQRNALFGPVRAQLKELVTYFEALGNSTSTLGFSNVRLAYDDILARLLYFIEAGSFGVKSTEGRISERFRRQDPFSTPLIDRVRACIEHFSTARANVGPYRFNKASVLSWLLFMSRFFPDAAPRSDFIQMFIIASSAGVTAHYVTEAARVFEDRSSLRVTDVSSVAYRDFSLCYIYHFMSGDRLPSRIQVDRIVDVEARLQARDDATFETALSEALDIERWSATL